MFTHKPGTADLWSANLTPEQDYLLTGPHPDDPEVGETMAVWLNDPDQDIGVELRLHAKDGVAEGRATVYWTDGRILQAAPNSKQITRGDAPEAENLKYRCVEPYRRWEYRIDEWNLFVNTDEEHNAGTVAPTTTAKVSLNLDATTVTPVWIQGTLLPEAQEAMRGFPGFWIAGRVNAGLVPSAVRYDQALSATGDITVDGEIRSFVGHGLRGHVRGVRKMDHFRSHAWMEAVFPDSGMAFGIQAHCSDVYGGQGYAFSEAFIWKDGRVYPNRIIYAPRIAGEDPYAEFLIELACDELGLTRITGHDTRVSWFTMGTHGLGGVSGQPMAEEQTMGLGRLPNAATLMSQSLAVFELDGVRGSGFTERSG